MASSDQARAISVLEVAYPGETKESFAHMSVGRCDQLLLQLRERLLGQQLVVWGRCPVCQEPVELTLSTRELDRAASYTEVTDAAMAERHTLSHGDVTIAFRLPDSGDLEAVRRCPDADSARRGLLARCTLAITGPDGAALAELPDGAAEALEREMDRLDPLAVMLVDLGCPSCGRRWLARLDIAKIVVTELRVQARVLMEEVASLAGHYHWSERSILEMSPSRRRAYLEMAGG